MRPLTKSFKENSFEGVLLLWVEWFLRVHDLLLFGTDPFQLKTTESHNLFHLYICNSYTLGVFVFGFNILLPVYGFTALNQKFLSRSHISRYEAFVDDYDISDKRKRFFGVIVLVRRIIYSLSLVLLYYYPLAQTIVPWIANLIVLALLIVYKPHHKNTKNVVETLTEVAFFGIHSCIVVFAIDDINKDLTKGMRKNIGWGVIALIVFIILIQAYILTKEQFAVARYLIKKVFAPKPPKVTPKKRIIPPNEPEEIIIIEKPKIKKIARPFKAHAVLNKNERMKPTIDLNPN
jgi:hypothetical protein